MRWPVSEVEQHGPTRWGRYRAAERRHRAPNWVWQRDGRPRCSRAWPPIVWAGYVLATRRRARVYSLFLMNLERNCPCRLNTSQHLEIVVYHHESILSLLLSATSPSFLVRVCLNLLIPHVPAELFSDDLIMHFTPNILQLPTAF